MPSKTRWSAWLDGIEAEFPELRTPNTFLRQPEPRRAFIDARRNDGCIPTITTLEA